MGIVLLTYCKNVQFSELDARFHTEIVNAKKCAIGIF